MTYIRGMPKQAAIVVNPSKFDDLDSIRGELDALAVELGWARPQWFETDPDDGGVQAAHRALASGADVVCAFGGDGTVRAVGAALRGGEVPLGLLPAGTGNLLARNLGIPLDDPAAAFRVALGETGQRIDVGLIEFDGESHPFLVAAGIGLDAEIMDSTDGGLKRQIGRLAYVVAGAKVLLQRGFATSVKIDGGRPVRQRARMILACNCAALQAGVEIAVDAQPDDGSLDVVTIRPAGIVGWLAVGLSVLTGRGRGNGLISQRSGREISVRLNRPVLAEIDGDVLGRTRSARFGVDPLALSVRIPG